MYVAVRSFDDSPFPHRLRTDLIDDPFLNQKNT